MIFAPGEMICWCPSLDIGSLPDPWPSPIGFPSAIPELCLLRSALTFRSAKPVDHLLCIISEVIVASPFDPRYLLPWPTWVLMIPRDLVAAPVSGLLKLVSPMYLPLTREVPGFELDLVSFLPFLGKRWGISFYPLRLL